MDQRYFFSLPEEVTIEGRWEDRDILIDGLWLDPRLSLKIANHSPDGFNWGYGGSGPAQLALAILLEYLPVKEAQEIYMAFKHSVVGRWPQANFSIKLNLKEAIKMILDAR